jgi:hypothetical protein
MILTPDFHHAALLRYCIPIVLMPFRAFDDSDCRHLDNRKWEKLRIFTPVSGVKVGDSAHFQAGFNPSGGSLIFNP